ncbi:MAG: carboxypeptidase-like regulatory domain-containing protein [Chitinophagaceae bacterium]
MKYLIAFLLLPFITASAVSQSANSIEGTIVNRETGAIIPNASIFITNTSKGTVSNSAGKFELTNVPVGTYDLVTSSIGYETEVYTYKASQLPMRMKIQLQPKAEELQTVVVAPYEKDGWLTWGQFFTDNFIGTSDNAQSCSIKNYKVLRFRNSKKKNQLTVTADEPLIIENKALGYRIQYQLEGFTYNFSEQILTYYGYSLFTTLQHKGPKEKQLKNREKAYTGSIAHFMSSLYNDRLAGEGFQVRRLVTTPNVEKNRVQKLYQQNPQTMLRAKDSVDYYEHVLRQPNMLEVYGQSILTADSLVTIFDAAAKKLFFSNYLYITYKKAKEDAAYVRYIHENRQPFYPRSIVFLPNSQAVMVDARGNYYMPLDIMSYGYWGWSEKIANMLPLDYKRKNEQ